MEKEKKKTTHSEKANKTTKVALFCLAAILIFYFGANFLKGVDMFSKKIYYYTILDNAAFLPNGANVYVEGYRIGKVTKVSLLNDSPLKVIAEVLITESIRIPQDSKFEISSKDLLGSPKMNLLLGESITFAKNRDTLSSVVVSSLTDGLDEMKLQLSSILSSIDTIGLSIKEVLNEGNSSSKLGKIFDNLEQTTLALNSILAQNKNKFSNIVTNLDQFSQTLSDATPQLKEIIAKIDDIADTVVKANIASTVINANHTITELNDIFHKINNGEGDVNQLLTKDSLYTKLDASIASLNMLMVDIKENPKRYVHFSLFGGKEKKNKK